MQFETKSALAAYADIHRSPAPRAWLRLLGQVMALADGRGELLRHAERPWASATFSGARHTIALVFNDPEAIAAGERLIAALPDHEFDLPTQLVADAAVREASHTLVPAPSLMVEIEILLLDDI